MHGEYKVPGGKLVVVDCELVAGELRGVQVSGDFFLEPPEGLAELDRALEGMPEDLSDAGIEERLAPVIDGRLTLVGFDAAAIARAVRRALA